MQPDAVAHDLRRDDQSLDALHDGEHHQHQQRMPPVLELHRGQQQGRSARDHRAEKRDHRQQRGHDAEQKGVVQTNGKKTNRVEHAVARRDEQLAAKKCDQVVVDRGQHEDQFLLEARILHRQIIRPLGLDAALLLQKIKGINGHQRQAQQSADP